MCNSVVQDAQRSYPACLFGCLSLSYGAWHLDLKRVIELSIYRNVPLSDLLNKSVNCLKR